MHDYNIVTYLFFLKRNPHDTFSFFNEIFHFYRFFCLKYETKWKKLFVVEDFQVRDYDYDFIQKTLLFHKFITKNNQLTEKGSVFLEKNLKKELFLTIFDDFLLQYKGQSATKDSCYVEDDFLVMSCGVCRHKSCLKKKENFSDLFKLPKIRKKNPTRSFQF